MNRTQVRPTDRRAVAEQLARCVATMVYYEADHGSWSGAQLLWEQSHSLVAWASEASLTDRLGEILLGPLQKELTDRFGSEAGRKLHEEFLRALDDASRA